MLPDGFDSKRICRTSRLLGTVEQYTTFHLIVLSLNSLSSTQLMKGITIKFLSLNSVSLNSASTITDTSLRAMTIVGDGVI